MIEYVAIFTLLAVIIFLIAERYFLVEQNQKQQDKLLDELSRMSKAVISKNANDYVMTASIDKVAAEEKPKADSDMIDPDTLSDDQFIEAIKK